MAHPAIEPPAPADESSGLLRRVVLGVGTALVVGTLAGFAALAWVGYQEAQRSDLERVARQAQVLEDMAPVPWRTWPRR